MKVENVIFHELPELQHPCLITAFAGWPDAAQTATGAVSYLIKKVKAKRFAELESEEFYVFTSLRTEVNIDHGIVTSLKFPPNSFFYYRDESGKHDLVIFRGIEPDLHWQKFTSILLDLAKQLGVARIYTLGGLYDRIPHTREPKVSGAVSKPGLTHLLEKHAIDTISYQGPSSVHSVLLAACKDKSIEALSLWGHAPFYVKAEANPVVCLSLLQKLSGLLEIEIDLSELREAADSLQEALDRLLTESDELRLYVQQLEEQYDLEGAAPREPLAGTDKIIREVEDFLKRERREGGASSNFPL